jgi:hypothetical protein
MEDPLRKVRLSMSKFIASLLREKLGPALLDWLQSVVDTWMVEESGSQVGMVRRPGHGTCVVRGRLIHGADIEQF